MATHTSRNSENHPGIITKIFFHLTWEIYTKILTRSLIMLRTLVLDQEEFWSCQTGISLANQNNRLLWEKTNENFRIPRQSLEGK